MTALGEELGFPVESAEAPLVRVDVRPAPSSPQPAPPAASPPAEPSIDGDGDGDGGLFSNVADSFGNWQVGGGDQRRGQGYG